MGKIGFIGLGIMGHAMAGNCIKAGHSLAVYNRTRSKADDLAARGARIADTPADAARGADIVISMLSTPDVVEEAAWADNGFAPAMAKGAIWIDSSTVDPAFSRKMARRAAEAGIRFIDAPVAGSKLPAEKGELIFLLGGGSPDIKAAMPYLKAMGKRFIHAGEHGKGAALKMVFNYCSGLGMAVFCEALVLGERLGLEKELLLDSLPGSHVVMPLITGKKHKFATDEYLPEFPLKWLQKDLVLATKSGWECDVSLPLGNIGKEIFEMAKVKGMGDLDFSAVYKFMKENY